jgi:hypothetical protein
MVQYDECSVRQRSLATYFNLLRRSAGEIYLFHQCDTRWGAPNLWHGRLFFSPIGAVIVARGLDSKEHREMLLASSIDFMKAAMRGTAIVPSKRTARKSCAAAV